MRYFALQIFGDTRTTAKAADVLVKVHSKAVGTDPVTNGRYDANDPESQLWIQVTAWHSILYCYEKMGPGPSPPEKEDQYWAANAVIASNPVLLSAVGGFLTPTTMPIAAPAILSIPAESPETMTPRGAQRKYGYDHPTEAHRRRAGGVPGLHRRPFLLTGHLRARTGSRSAAAGPPRSAAPGWCPRRSG